VLRSSDYNVGTELILLSVRVFVEFSDGMHNTRTRHAIKRSKCQIGVLLCSWKVQLQNEAIPTILPGVQIEKWKALKPRVKAANGHKADRETHEILWGECEMCTESDKEGSAWERQVAVQVAEVQNMARHILITLVLWL
jgi:hypothetical protein